MALISCKECGKQVSDLAAACPNCGAPVADRPLQAAAQAVPILVTAPKSRSALVLLAMLGGGIGLHKFYLNRPGLGVLYMLFVWTLIPSIIGFFEGLSYLSLSDADLQEKFSGIKASRTGVAKERKFTVF